MDNKNNKVNQSKDIKEKETTKSGQEIKLKDIKEKEMIKPGLDNIGNFKSQFNWKDDNNQSGQEKNRRYHRERNN